ncbi:MAG TPA: XRE family transcriptional regulator [Lachnospiraceae bacterium]|nr:XRE family transcriptional regulator [Lachnospiraceae bacterium]
MSSKDRDVFKVDYIRRIKDLREDSDYTQNDVADMLGISQTMYARYERGATALPIRHLITLCKIYSTSSDYMLGMDDIKDRKSDDKVRSKKTKKK